MISSRDVVEAYRHLLGREPENEEVIAYHQTHSSLTALRHEILSSGEFAALYNGLGVDPATVLKADTFAPLLDVETTTEGPARDRMWARVAENWRKLGEEAPHWSVLTLDQFRPDSIERNRDVFEKTVSIDMGLVDDALERLPDAATLQAGCCLEIGCGVGRITRGLSERFDRVLAVDVSAPHLAIAEQDMAQAGCTNVDFRCLERIEDYSDLGKPSFLYSRIVLQHNPPPVQTAILRTVLDGLASPGAALFQVITHIEDYGFSTERYLKGVHDGMEMHVLPQRELFAIMRETGVDVIEFNRDDSAIGDSRYRSCMMLGHKK